jgi:fructosamine-3-kinase
LGGDFMSVEEAAKKLGMHVQTLRLALQQNKFPFGTAIMTTSAEKSTVGKPRWTYYINEKRLENYLKGVDYANT